MYRTAPFVLLYLASAAILPPGRCPGDDIDFSRDIRPILSENCFTCHGPDEASREAGLRLDDEKSAKADDSGSAAIVPGKPEESAIIQRIKSDDPDLVMPPLKLHKTLSPSQILSLEAWIRQGAVWGKHWSYEQVRRPSVPDNGEANPIDAFLKARLIREKLDFSPEADQAALIRRLALDTTGLPPTLDEQAALAKLDYPAVVDYFMSKPAFGEHWAREWLDLARYADSAGYPSDPGREIWLYRDWVVRALNDNMPFDQFTVEQIAGDLLPKPTQDQLIATAFHRNTMTQNEGGTNDEEFRTAAVIDRVNTTFAVWMGTTMACAQCHTHKYDPITNREFFEIYAFLNQTADADKKDESPLEEVIDPAVKAQRIEWIQEQKALQAKLAKPKPEWLEGFEEWLASKPKFTDARLKKAFDEPIEKRTTEQTKQLEQYFVKNVSRATKAERKRSGELQKMLDETKPITVPIMQDLPDDQRRKTFVQLRGNWQALGEEVEAAVPVALHPLPENAPRNRLGLARWLVDRSNPLTARVTMNRMWESIFGVGIVRSSEEFGSQGDMPVHPTLLDWLAAEFMDSGWDRKHMMRLLLNSRAYRQVTTSSSELNERDPDNRWLARGPRFRPSGELLRDQALAVSGLLSSKMFGPPVRPLRPNLGLSTAFGRSNDWEISQGEDLHRRSLYTEVRRNSPYPSFTTFDAPNRETCTLRRGRSNTPLQAFVTLNDPVFIEAAQALARRIIAHGGKTDQARIGFVYQVCLSREPSPEDTQTLLEIVKTATETYSQDVALADKMACDPLGPAPKGTDIVELAAWSTLANVVMNLDEFLMRK